MAKKEAIEKDEPAPVQKKRDPAKTIGFETDVFGEHRYVDAPEGWERDRVVLADGARYEACAIDSEGCWIYRQRQ